LQPDLLVFAESHSESAPLAVEALATLPGWSIVEAVSKRRVAVISDAVNRPAPRILSAMKTLPSSFTRTLSLKNRKATKKRTRRTILPRTTGPLLILLSRPPPAGPYADFWRLRMRPLTLSRLLFQCLVLTAILFVVVVVAMKFGARARFPFYALGRDLVRFVLGQSSQISTDYGFIILEYPRPAPFLLGIIVGASLSVAGNQLPSFAAQSVS